MKYLNALEDFLVMFIIAVMGAVLALQVAMRYLFNHPLIWSEEMARYLFVWMTFLGASYGVRHHIHINMAIVFNTFPRPLKLASHLVTNIAAIVIFTALIPAGWRFVEDQSFLASSAMDIPLSWVFAAVPVGCTLVAARLLADSVKTIRNGGADL